MRLNLYNKFYQGLLKLGAFLYLKKDVKNYYIHGLLCINTLDKHIMKIIDGVCVLKTQATVDFIKFNQ